MKIEFYSIAFMASDPVYHNGDVKALFILIVPLSFRRKPEQAKTEKQTNKFFSTSFLEFQSTYSGNDALCSVQLPSQLRRNYKLMKSGKLQHFNWKFHCVCSHFEISLVYTNTFLKLHNLTNWKLMFRHCVKPCLRPLQRTFAV